MSEIDFAMQAGQAAAPAEPAEPAEPAWTGPSQDEWGSVMEYISAQQQAQQEWEQQQYAAQQQYAPQQPAIDPFAEDFGSQLGGFIQNQVQQAISPLMEFQYGQQLSEAEDRALDILDDDVARNGDFIHKEQAFEAARALAGVYFSEEAQRYGYGPEAAEAALQRAAAEVRAYEKAVSEAAISRHLNHLTDLSGATREPSAAAASVQSGFKTGPGGDELDVVRAFGGFGGR